MKKLTILFAAVLFFVSTLCFADSLESLDKDQANNAIKGKTIKTISLITLNGKLVNNAFTGYFDETGKIKGKFTNKPENDPQTDQGFYLVKDDGTLCATWDHWNNNKPICVAIYDLKNGMLFVNKDNKKLETIVLAINVKQGNQLS